MSWLVEHNPDIDWTNGKIKWRSEHCQKHRLPSKIKIERMTEEEMLREAKEQRHVFGMTVFHNEDGEDISLRLVDHYKDYADIFSEAKIHALPEHSTRQFQKCSDSQVTLYAHVQFRPREHRRW